MPVLRSCAGCGLACVDSPDDMVRVDADESFYTLCPTCAQEAES